MRRTAQGDQLREHDGDAQLLLGLAYAALHALTGLVVATNRRVQPPRLGVFAGSATLEKQAAIRRDDPDVRAAMPVSVAMHLLTGFSPAQWMTTGIVYIK